MQLFVSVTCRQYVPAPSAERPRGLAGAPGSAPRPGVSGRSACDGRRMLPSPEPAPGDGGSARVQVGVDDHRRPGSGADKVTSAMKVHSRWYRSPNTCRCLRRGRSGCCPWNQKPSGPVHGPGTVPARPSKGRWPIRAFRNNSPRVRQDDRGKISTEPMSMRPGLGQRDLRAERALPLSTTTSSGEVAGRGVRRCPR